MCSIIFQQMTFIEISDYVVLILFNLFLLRYIGFFFTLILVLK